MPATDRLLTKLHETLGEGPTDDLVAWVNEGRAVNRAEVRELADLYLIRFDERLERRLAELDVKLERRFAEQDAKLDQRLIGIEQRTAELQARFEQRLAEQETRLGSRIDRLEVTLERRLGEQTRWLFGAWAALLIPIIGLWLRG